MKVVFFSNFLTHHQLPFCLEMQKRLGENYWFVATERLANEQKMLGYDDLNERYPFVLKAYEGEEKKQAALKLAMEADVVIFGSAPIEYVQERLKKKKITFCYSERLYKSGFSLLRYPVRLMRFFNRYGKYKSFYLLCASAYTAADFAKSFCFINKAYKWGYFPEVKVYENPDVLISEKKPGSILWAGRFIDWKHPEYVVEVARRLRADGYTFHIQMLGNGEKHEEIQKLVSAYGLEPYVTLTGAIPSEQVRSYMEQAQIYLFTSDRHEGWGAVLNESMNSGCTVVASDAIGAVPFLLDNGKNGLTYHSGDVADLYQKVKSLLDQPDECNRLGANAYTTMTGTWNAEIAAERVIHLSNRLLRGEKHPYPYTDGPCSKADILKG
mgnify:CR=1 FL=1